jgi:tRNA G18 (ribose-2'-O)-methylase SpoU
MKKKLNAKKIRTIDEKKAKIIGSKLKRKDIYFILEDVLDTYNVGGFFRLADAVGAKKIYLCGQTSTPPNTKIKKASIGTYKFTPWKYYKETEEAVIELKEIDKLKVIAVEQHKKSVDYRQAEYNLPLAFLFGSENYGLNKKSIKLADEIIEIPMYGINISLNVMIAAGIVVYKGLENIN